MNVLLLYNTKLVSSKLNSMWQFLLFTKQHPKLRTWKSWMHFYHVLGDNTWKGRVLLHAFLAIFNAPLAFIWIYFCHTCFIANLLTLQVWQCTGPYIIFSLTADYVKYAKQSAQLFMRGFFQHYVCDMSRQSHSISHNWSLYSKCTVMTVKSVIVHFFAVLLLDCVWNVMAHAETRFRLSAKWMSPFKSAGASVQSTTNSRGVRISGSNAEYIVFRGSVKSTDHPLHSTVSPSFPLPCVTVCHHISTELYPLCVKSWYSSCTLYPHTTHIKQ
jgi:hypothetical protein